VKGDIARLRVVGASVEEKVSGIGKGNLRETRRELSSKETRYCSETLKLTLITAKIKTNPCMGRGGGGGGW